MRHLLSIRNLTETEFFRLLERGKVHRRNRMLHPAALAGKKVALLFEKSSTRTRLSFTVAVYELGGMAIPLETQMLQMGRGESIEDTTEVMARYVDAVMLRARHHSTLEKMAAMNRIPVINGLSDAYHPCQALADFMTVEQYGLSVRGGLRLAFVGEPNNVFNSLALGSIYAKAQIRIATPPGYPVRPDVLSLLRENGISLEIFTDPVEAVKGAQVVYTDVWVSMGQEQEEQERKKAFSPYCVSESLLKHAADEHIVLHCLPAHRGEEITAGVMDRYRDPIFNQAENRLHIQKAILEWIFNLQ